jgi:hypothetical protein
MKNHNLVTSTLLLAFITLSGCEDTQNDADLDQCGQSANADDSVSCVDEVLATAEESTERTEALDFEAEVEPSAYVPCGIYVPPVAYSPGQTPTYYYTI